MSLTAPYTNAMRIGQGFNTYTQEIRLENAVTIGSKRLRATELPNPVPTPPITPDVSTIKEPLGEVPVVNINGKPASRDVFSPPVSAPTTPYNVNFDGLGVATDVVSSTPYGLPFNISSGPGPITSQSVTYSTRAIENVSDIMDALNISTSMSIKYGTIHGNGNASFVNETKVLDSELNYIVSVTVNNDAEAAVEDMTFQDIPDLPLERFTEVYGDSFISGFTEGGEFNAVISIKLNDKSKHRAVKQAVDVQLAVGPPTLEVGASESFDKEHAEVLKNTEISISVNWIGGGEIKKPNVPWTIRSVVAVANAFPSMVARSSARTQAILTRYSSLRTFQAWKWRRLLDAKATWEKDPKNQKGGESNKDGKHKFEEPVIVLNYVPCSLYTADLFDALMNYKKLWKRIGEILQNPSKYKIRPRPSSRTVLPALAPKPFPKNVSASTTTLSPIVTRQILKSNIMNSPIDSSSNSPSVDKITESGMERAFTFAVEEGATGWNLVELNMRSDPIPPEPFALNEARLLCREAMTLITEEAARLVDHPHLAYAEFNANTMTTRMKRPNYAYPEVLKERLPIPIHNDIISDLSTDGAYLKTVAYSQGEDVWFETDMVGDPKANDTDLRAKFGPAKYEDFSTLELTEPKGSRDHNPLRRLALHKYRLGFGSSIIARSGLKAADGAIGAIGLARVQDSTPNEKDGCVMYFGHRHHSDQDDHSTFRTLELGNVDITKIDVAYVPGSGYIAGVTFFDRVNEQETPRLSWRQWEGKEPAGLVHVINEPPERGDGTVWKFAGLAGSWIDTVGQGHVLARLSGIWKKTVHE